MNKTSAVPARAIPGTSTPIHRVWVDRTVWTERMLAALGNGVKGDKTNQSLLAVCLLRRFGTLHHDKRSQC